MLGWKMRQNQIRAEPDVSEEKVGAGADWPGEGGRGLGTGNVWLGRDRVM